MFLRKLIFAGRSHFGATVTCFVFWTNLNTFSLDFVYIFFSVAFSEWWFCFVWASPGTKKVCSLLFLSPRCFHQMTRHQGCTLFPKSFISVQVFRYLVFCIFYFNVFIFCIWLFKEDFRPTDGTSRLADLNLSWVHHQPCLALFRKSIESLTTLPSSKSKDHTYTSCL